MKKFILVLLFLPLITKAQNTFKAVIRNLEAKEPIAGASIQIKILKLSAIANDAGIAALNNVPNGNQLIEITSIGYKDVERSITFPQNIADTVSIFLEQAAKELEGITVSTTRSNRSINSTPTRVEVIAEEEVHEEATMRL